MVVTVSVVGVILLLLFAVSVGISMDTERQRHVRQRVAAERRKLAQERRAAGGCEPQRCRDCPLRIADHDPDDD